MHPTEHAPALPASVDLAIVGAGPAGMAAAEAAVECGLSVAVVDEQFAAGGQILRQPPAQFRVKAWLPGKVYQRGKALLSRVADRPQINWFTQSTVAGIFERQDASSAARFTLAIDGPDEVRELAANAVLLAPGCFDLPVVFPGWNIPGVMAAGGIQAFIKSQQFVPGQRFLFVGSHPLQLVVADQVVQAGGEVAGVLFAQSRSTALQMLRQPGVMLGGLAKLGQTAAILLRLQRAGVPVRFNQTLVQANGSDFLQSVTVAPLGSDGLIQSEQREEIACDRLGVCFGFLTSSELARQCEARCDWDASRGGWVAQHDQWMCSSVSGIYVAGEITGVAGSDVAIEEGRLAGLGCALKLGHIDQARARELAAPVRQKLAKLNRFARMLADLSWPGSSLFDQLMTDSATLCKCEGLTVGEVVDSLSLNSHIATASSAKLLTRAGMGLCQGRYCHFALTRLLSGRLGVPEQEVGAYTARFPAKPVDIGHLIGPDS